MSGEIGGKLNQDKILQEIEYTRCLIGSLEHSLALIKGQSWSEFRIESCFHWIFNRDRKTYTNHMSNEFCRGFEKLIAEELERRKAELQQLVKSL